MVSSSLLLNYDDTANCYILPSLRFDVRVNSNSLIIFGAFDKFCTGSHVASCNGYPVHLTRYCIFFQIILLSSIASTSYSSSPVLDSKIAGGGVGLANSSGEG